jgi:hypothetical protein
MFQKTENPKGTKKYNEIYMHLADEVKWMWLREYVGLCTVPVLLSSIEIISVNL